jgi:ABC-type nitrate/sulfonate/bicarbonate transport system permease component
VQIEKDIGMTSKASLRKTISPLMLIFLWEIGVQTNIINPLFLPAPSAIAKASWQLLISGDLVRHAGTSLWRAFCGLSIGAPLAIISGVFIGLKRSGEDYLEPPLELLRSIPPVSMISVALLWFGIGAKLSIFIIAWATFFPLYINTIAGVRKAEPRFIQAARTLGAGQSDLLIKIVMPQAMPMIFAGLRTSLATSLMGAIITEMFGAQSGLGFLIMDSERFFFADKMFVGVICISMLGYLLSGILAFIEHKTSKWQKPLSMAKNRNGII